MWPDDPYLVKLGKVSYAASYLEALILNDLGRFPDDLPADLLDAEALSVLSNKVLAEKLRGAVVADQSIARWLTVAADELDKARAVRNDVLHARPVTDSEARQRLMRWQDPTRTGWLPAGNNMLSDEVIDDALRLIEGAISAVQAAHIRP